MVSPRASIATRAAIFLARPSGDGASQDILRWICRADPAPQRKPDL